MKRALLAAILFAPLAFGQIQLLHVVSPGVEKELPSVVSLGSVAMGESSTMTVRVRNSSQSTLVIRALEFGGTGFSVSGKPSIPHDIAPGSNMDMEVRFSPTEPGSYNGHLTINGVRTTLTGSSIPMAVLTAGGVRVASGGRVDLGVAERGTTLSKVFRIENGSAETVYVQSATVTGKYFGLDQNVPTPMELAPGNAYELVVSFTPLASGVFEGAIVIDGRSYRITGGASEPPFPKPTLVVDLPNPASAQQGKVSVHLGQASRSIGTGKLRMEFNAGAVADEAVRFTRGASRSATFEVKEGTVIALPEYTFQTGTTAGTIVFTAEVGGWTATASVEILPDRILVEKARAVKNGSMLEVEVTGYDNTRTVDGLAFTFYTSKGEAVQPGMIRVNSAADFRKHFDASASGGVFTLKAVFPVAGPLTDIATAEVQLTNTRGSTATGKILLQ